MSHRRQVALVFIGTALAAACGGGSSGPPPRTLEAFSGTPQTDSVLATLLNPLVVLARENSNPVSGVVVTWTAPGNGKVNGAGTAQTTTGADGKASVSYQLGSTAGAQTPTAAATGLGGSPVSFAITATAGVATQIAKTAGDGSSATVNSQVTYTVTARDSHSNPRQGVAIDWAATGGGGSITPAQSTTGATGTASATRTLSGTAGAHTATATAAAIPQTVTFTTTAVAAPLTASVDVGNNFFAADSVLIRAGGQVTWTWAGQMMPGHNVTFSGGTPANCANATAAGTTCTRTFPTAGTFAYTCTNHATAGMTGKVVVVP